jgi:serine/threonine protein kinase
MHEVLRRVGRYEILGEVGRGGMATVYIARQVGLGRNVALKELSAFHAADPMAAERFVRESQVAASLAHPNIVTVHDFFQEQGTPYIAMEYLDRGSLRPYMKRLSVAQVAGVLEGVLAGLTHAEAAGVVHRDLKPENLLVASDGGVKIADFGIAKAQRAIGSGRALTATGSTVGTPSYMAPEQAMARDIGPWTDLYSVGILAYEALSGQTPFPDEETPMAVLLHHINDPVPPLRSIDPRIDPALAEWVESLLVKDPAKRTRNAYAAWDVLEGIVIDVVGARWRRNARLVTKLETVETPQPLTPAPFESSVQTPTPTPPEVAREPDPDREPAEPEGPRTSGFVTFRGGRRAARQPVPEKPPTPEGPRVSEQPPEPPAQPPEPPPQPVRGEAEEENDQSATVAPRHPPPEVESKPATPAAEPAPVVTPKRLTRGRVAAAAGLTVALAVVGFLAGHSESGSAAKETPKRSLAAGDLRVTYPARWREIANAPELDAAGVPEGVAVGPARTGHRLVAGMVDAAGPTLLPPKLLESLGSEPQSSEAVRLGNLEALRHTGLRPQGSPTELTIFSAPTTAGVATIACVAHPAELPAFDRECENAATTARLGRGRPLRLGPSAAYAAALSATLSRLRSARRQSRRRLTTAKTPSAQARAAATLAGVYARAERALARRRVGSFESDAHAGIRAALGGSRRAYDRLAQAARRGQRPAYAAAAGAIRRSEAGVQRALGRLEGLGYAID